MKKIGAIICSVACLLSLGIGSSSASILKRPSCIPFQLFIELHTSIQKNTKNASSLAGATTQTVKNQIAVDLKSMDRMLQLLKNPIGLCSNVNSSDRTNASRAYGLVFNTINNMIASAYTEGQAADKTLQDGGIDPSSMQSVQEADVNLKFDQSHIENYWSNLMSILNTVDLKNTQGVAASYLSKAQVCVYPTYFSQGCTAYPQMKISYCAADSQLTVYQLLPTDQFSKLGVMSTSQNKSKCSDKKWPYAADFSTNFKTNSADTVIALLFKPMGVGISYDNSLIIHEMLVSN